MAILHLEVFRAESATERKLPLVELEFRSLRKSSQFAKLDAYCALQEKPIHAVRVLYRQRRNLLLGAAATANNFVLGVLGVDYFFFNQTQRRRSFTMHSGVFNDAPTKTLVYHPNAAEDYSSLSSWKSTPH